jgi:hypothetical protein
MRIERAQHPDDRRLVHIVVIQFFAVDVLFLDHLEGFIEVSLEPDGRGTQRRFRRFSPGIWKCLS